MDVIEGGAPHGVSLYKSEQRAALEDLSHSCNRWMAILAGCSFPQQNQLLAEGTI